MKQTEQDIEKIAEEYSNIGKDVGLTHKEYTLEKIAFTKGFQTCQTLQKENWISVDDKMPLTYLEGHWDGLASDDVLVQDDKGVCYVATLYTGFLDGTEFNDFYDNRDFDIKNVIKWKPIIK